MIKPLISEKSMSSIKDNKYCFIVPVNFSKKKLSQMMKEYYNVDAIKINSQKRRGKKKVYKRVKGVRQDYKIIIITLKTGQKIDGFEIEKPTDDKSVKAKK